MSRIEQAATRGIILQELTYQKPPKKKLKEILYAMGTKITLTPNNTQGLIQGEWYGDSGKTSLARTSMELWNKTPVKLKTLIQAVNLFAGCDQVKILEILPIN